MFPLSMITSRGGGNQYAPGNSASTASSTLQSPSSHLPPKKTFAATLVENAKKQSIASIPKEIAKLAQRFLPVFNPDLFPHKPPPQAVANRILFTDAEDE